MDTRSVAGNKPQASVRHKTSINPPKISVLSLIAAACSIIAIESILDLLFAGNQMRGVSRLVDGMLTRADKPEFWGFGVIYWLPIVPICLWLGVALRHRGVAYSAAGAVVFLVVLHLFRGFGTRHNVFETAEAIRAGLWPGLPSPLFWDISYIAVATLAAMVGWGIAAIVPSWRDRPGLKSVGKIPALWTASACAVVGLVESIVTIAKAQPKVFICYTIGNEVHEVAPTTHGYAVLLVGLIACGLVIWREHMPKIRIE